VIVSATEANGPRPVHNHRSPLLTTATLLAVLALALSGCAEEALPERRLTADDCLTNVEIDRLDAALKRCDRVVAAFPREPQPLNERFLLHSLQGKEEAACRDIRHAFELIRRMPARRLDPLLRHQLDLRQASCLDQPGDAAPAGEPPHSSQANPANPAVTPAAIPLGHNPAGGRSAPR
jgi:hypothetical protein